MTMDCFYQTPDDNGLKSISCTFYCETCLNGTHFGTTYLSGINSCSDYTGYIWRNFTCWDFTCFFDSNRIALFSGVSLWRGLTVSDFIDVKLLAHLSIEHLFIFFVRRNLLNRVRVMVFNTTFNKTSVITWPSVLLVEETRVPGKNNRIAGSHWQTLSHNIVSSTPRHERDSNSQSTFVVIGTDYISSSKFKWHTIMTTLSLLNRVNRTRHNCFKT